MSCREERRAFPEGHCARVAASPRARVVYPRIDPAVIALVSCGDYALLGRQARWAPGRYSCLAGPSHTQLLMMLDAVVSSAIAELLLVAGRTAMCMCI